MGREEGCGWEGKGRVVDGLVCWSLCLFVTVRTYRDKKIYNKKKYVGGERVVGGRGKGGRVVGG